MCATERICLPKMSSIPYRVRARGDNYFTLSFLSSVTP